MDIGRTLSTLGRTETVLDSLMDILQPLSEDRLRHMALLPSQMSKPTLNSSFGKTRRLHYRTMASRSSYLRFIYAWRERLAAAERFGQIPRLATW